MEISQYLEILYYRCNRLRSAQHKHCLKSSVFAGTRGNRESNQTDTIGLNCKVLMIDFSSTLNV